MSSSEMNYSVLLEAIGQAHQQAQAGAAGAVNRQLILRNWIIGAYLVEFEQNGKDRAQYGARLIARVATDLASREISGLGVSMLKNCRQFFRLYPQIRQPAVGELPTAGNSLPIGQPLVDKSAQKPISSPTVAASFPTPLSPRHLMRFSWTHFLEFIRISDPWKRAFYENECLKGNWSKRQLQRQIGSLLYERTGLSTDKEAVIQAGREQAHDTPQAIADLIRDPYVKDQMMGEGDNPPVGLILCTDKDQTKVEYAAGGLDRQLFVSRYLVALPKPEQLQELVENDRAQWEQQQALEDEAK